MLSPRRLPLPTDRWVRLLLPAVLIFFAAASDRNYQTDLWHHLARGRAMVETGHLVDEDRFTYTVAGQPLRDVNWGWQAAFFELYEIGDLALVQTVNAALLAAMMLALTWFCWRCSNSLRAAMLTGVFTFFGLWQLLLIRPQTLSLLLYVLLLIVLDAATERRHWLIVPPLLLAVWVNVHGGFPIGLVLIGAGVLAQVLGAIVPNAEDLVAAGKPLPAPTRPVRLAACWPWVLCLLASAAATLANPYGWGIYEYVLQTAGRASARRIDEWLPPSPKQLTGMVFVLSVAALLVLFGVSERRPRRRELCILCGLLPLAAGSVRMVAWWLLAAAPILAAQLVALWLRLRDDSAQDRPSLGATLTCLGYAAAVVLATPWLERANPALLSPGRAHRVEADLQVVAERVAASGSSGRIFTRLEWAEYLGWALAGRYTVFEDGRIEIIPDPIWAEYSAITRGRSDWNGILQRYRVTHLVLDAGSGYHAELLPLVQSSRDWREMLRQEDAVVFERAPPPP